MASCVLIIRLHELHSPLVMSASCHMSFPDGLGQDVIKNGPAGCQGMGLLDVQQLACGLVSGAVVQLS